jgi:hypothetical protein
LPDRILIEEFHLTFTVRPATPDAVCEAIRRALSGRAFRSELRAAVRAVLARYPALARARAVLTV